MSPSEAQPLAPGATIGILGGGQLGRMLAIAAARLGFRCHIFEPGEDPPAGHVAAQTTRASYDDRAALRQFGSTADVITYEFENVPLTALDHLAGLAPIRPGRRALEVAQDRVTEKSFLNSLAIPTAEFVAIDSRDELDTSPVAEPLILKTRRLGYDGKGQARIEQASREARDRAWDAMQGAPAIAEQLVAFTREISVIAARSLAGQVVCFDPAENVHRDGILHTSTVT
ncbi:MAG: ATP-grasp domain-containing protein, partial [Pseudomonadota bacterium]